MGVCEYSNQLSSYLDGELDAGRRTVLEAHLCDCGNCDLELRELRGLSRLFAAAAGPFLSAKALGRFHNRISELEDEQAQAERTAFRVLRFTRILTGIAACLLVAGSLWLVRSRQQAADAPTKYVELTSPATPAPWDAAIQPVETGAPPVDAVAPADTNTDWMVGGLVSSAPVGHALGDDD